MTARLERELSELDWWCFHYKEGLHYLSSKMYSYFNAVNNGDTKSAESLKTILEAVLPEYIKLGEE
jgi:hypothetical protein